MENKTNISNKKQTNHLQQYTVMSGPNLIEWEEWHHECADGCCDKWGIEVWVDGKSIGSKEFGDAGSVLEMFLESENRKCEVRQRHSNHA